MQIIGHRGARALLPQNTLPSIELAFKNKMTMIEFDTELAKTGEVIIFHDDEVDQITRGQAHGPINDFSFEEIRKLNVHDGFEDGNFYRVPTLQEVFELTDKYAIKNGSKAKLNVELKGKGTAAPVAKIIKEYLQKGWRHEDFIVSSFRHDELPAFKNLIPEIEIAMLLNNEQWAELGSVEAAVELAKKLQAVAINPDLTFVTQKLIKASHDNGFEVNVYTVNKPEDILRMRYIGADAIFTDDFITTRKVLGEQSP